MNLRELREWPAEIDDLATATREAATNHTNSADFYRVLAKASTWEGEGGDAARSAMLAAAGDHDAAAENLTTAATGMGRTQEQAELIDNQIKNILDDAAAGPYPVEIDQDTNQVIPPSTDYLTDEAAAEVAAKVTDLQERVAAVLAAGRLVDSDLGQAIRAASGASETAATPAPGQIGPFPVPRSVATAAKPADDTPTSPESLDDALEQVAGQPAAASAAGPAAGAASVPLDPKAVESAKASARRILQDQGVPADQIEARVDAMVAAARQPLPDHKPTEKPGPGPSVSDGFAEGWFNAEERLRDVIGANGWEDFKDSWADMGKGAWERITNPIDSWTAEVEHATKYPGHYLGEQLGETAYTAPGAILGGEAALVARGAGELGDGIPHQVIDGPGPAPAADPLAAGLPDNPLLAGHGPTSAHDLPFEVGNPIDVSRPEFTLANPAEHMSPELLRLSEQHLTGSGETVLGPYQPSSGGPSYIEVAEDRGASYFDIGDAWYTSTPTQQLAANQHVLDVAIANGDTIRLSVPYDEIRPDSYTGAEIRYLQANGYERVDDWTFAPPDKGGN
ncbi:hypothetical protein [Mycobacterium hubeiense]|uniref:hypothetical protein n=1 Tax=Mycobacterium hubeiense TaxID=1867256 RepID=UPI001E401B13|nr:hypothetical protein [Mycobacterium sp. QGD 101]